jgi:single-strand DNA-binding protein
VLNFTVAVNTWDGRAKAEKSTWVRVAVFGKRAESLAKILSKGTQVVVTGDLSIREYTDKDGVVKTSVDINANTVVPMFAAKQGGQGNYERKTAHGPGATDDDQIPFAPIGDVG